MEPRQLDTNLNQKLKAAWEVRQSNFPGFIQFDYPEQTASVSMTGGQCSLDCAHCGGYYLQQMMSTSELEQTQDQFSSCLISGGCNSRGQLNILEHKAKLQELGRQYRLNLHTGLINSSSEARTIAKLADTVSFDFVADQETIEEVYGIDRLVTDYIASYQYLRDYVDVVPHICIGLKGGRLAGEYKALEILSQLGVERIVFIVFIPTPGTVYEDRTPPDLAAVINLLCWARIKFPTIPLQLGCMRPKGRYRAELDYYAVRAGINKLVVPTSWGVNSARQLGLKMKMGEECCVL